jgi:hypothetical protein
MSVNIGFLEYRSGLKMSGTRQMRRTGLFVNREQRGKGLFRKREPKRTRLFGKREQRGRGLFRKWEPRRTGLFGNREQMRRGLLRTTEPRRKGLFGNRESVIVSSVLYEREHWSLGIQIWIEDVWDKTDEKTRSVCE